MTSTSAGERPDCFRCRSFQVTHDQTRPYGCAVFGFKSRILPRDEVRLSSGRECHAFERKRRTGRGGTEDAEA
jgi:hypothetical protein